MIKIGWAISKTRPFAAGAAVTTLQNYEVCVKDVNAADGINVGGKKMKIGVIEYDDGSNSEDMIKAVERLATQDKVDFILPPRSTGANPAAAPISTSLPCDRCGVMNAGVRPRSLPTGRSSWPISVTPVIDVSTISAFYGNHRALDGVTLTVARGELAVILGANGAGKTTPLKAIGGRCPPPAQRPDGGQGHHGPAPARRVISIWR